jgi:uncharacterized protein (DUF1800 family)
MGALGEPPVTGFVYTFTSKMQSLQSPLKSTRAQVAHVLRRLGLGASRQELDFYERLGVEGTVERLINFDKYEEGFPVSVWEFATQRDETLVLQPPHVVAWWVLRMMVTQRPLQEKLTLFWHDHFAVSAEKVALGPVMYEYLQTLRKYSNGKFEDLLLAISKDPAMILWLDTNTNVKGKPNENFAREVMELFTMGVDRGYTEKDIQEAARAFTGWSLQRADGPRRVDRPPTKEEILQLVNQGKPLVEFRFRPFLHDSGEKNVLGVVGNLSGEDVIRILSRRQETSEYVPKKMWEWFAYLDPESKIVNKLSEVYRSSEGDIKVLIKTMVEMDEFWSAKCVRKQVKNPVDFTVALCRQFGMGQMLMNLRSPEATPVTPLPRVVVGFSGIIGREMSKQGMTLLYPPDVAGWDWGTAWISSATMLERIKLANVLFEGRGLGGLSALLGNVILNEFRAEKEEDVVDALLAITDAEVSAETRKVLVEACRKEGGISALRAPRLAGALLRRLCTVLFATPEFQFC